MNPRRSGSAVRFRAGLLFGVLVLAVAGCGDDGDGVAESTTTTSTPSGCTAERPIDPLLPTDINTIPYLFTDNVALGNWKVRIRKLTDPWTNGAAAPAGARNIAIDLEVENGALGPQKVIPEVFFVYDTNGCGTNPITARSNPPLAQRLPSTAVADVRLVFTIPGDRDPGALLFRGTETYGPGVLNGLIALDPDYRPAEPSGE